MSRLSWFIEHRRLGAYLGIGEHPRTGKIAAIYRSDNDRRPAALFATKATAQDELEDIADDLSPFTILPLNS